jgi:hypothetical protein
MAACGQCLSGRPHRGQVAASVETGQRQSGQGARFGPLGIAVLRAIVTRASTAPPSNANAATALMITMIEFIGTSGSRFPAEGFVCAMSGRKPSRSGQAIDEMATLSCAGHEGSGRHQRIRFPGGGQKKKTCRSVSRRPCHFRISKATARIRTEDLCFTKASLCQLSYGGLPLRGR